MEGICLALARRGYFAAAAHYQRLENLKRRNPLICCRSYEEGTTAYVHLLAQPQVNPERIGLLGFSIGGTHSLLIAASEPGIRAVVAYYPLADAEKWLDHDRQSLVRSLRSRMVQRQLMKELGVSHWEEALPEVRAASPIRHVERIQAPVLLIHGEKDRTVPVGQSEDLYQEFQSRGKSCQLLILPRAGHTFNFRDEERAKITWEKTLQFLDVHLQGEHPLPASGS